MKAKTYLRQYEDAERKVKLLCKEYEEEELMIDAIKSTTDFDGMPRGKSNGRNTVLDKVIRLEKKHSKLLEAKAEAVEIRQRVFDTIYKVQGEEQTVLIKRYIDMKRWEEIAVEMNFSWSGIHKLHRRALASVQDIIGA